MSGAATSMNARALTFARWYTMMRAVAQGKDPREAGQAIGMSPSQISKALAQCVQVEILEVVGTKPPAPGAPPFIKSSNVHGLGRVGRFLLDNVE